MTQSINPYHYANPANNSVRRSLAQSFTKLGASVRNYNNVSLDLKVKYRVVNNILNPSKPSTILQIQDTGWK